MKKVSKKIKEYGLIVSSLCSVIPVNFLDTEQNKTICLKYMYKNFELSEIVDTRLVLIKNGPEEIKKLSGSIAHIHIVDDNGTNDTNDVLGTGKVPISDYINACIESGIEDTCQRYNVLPVAAMEIGSFRRPVYQPKNEAKMSLEFLKENLSFLELK